MKLQINFNETNLFSSESTTDVFKKLVRIIDDFLNDSSDGYCNFDVLNQTKSFVDKQKLRLLLLKNNYSLEGNNFIYLERGNDNETAKITISN